MRSWFVIAKWNRLRTNFENHLRTEGVYPPRDKAVAGSQWIRKSPSDRIRFANPTPFRLRTETKSVLKRSWGFGLGWVFAYAKWIRNCEVVPTSKNLMFPNFMKFSKFIKKFQKNTSDPHQLRTEVAWAAKMRTGSGIRLRSDFGPHLRYAIPKSERNIFSHWVPFI